MSSQSPVRVHGKAQRPRPQGEELSHSFRSFCRAPIESSFSPRGLTATSSMAQCGSAIDHAGLRVYTQFGPASEDWRKAVVIHRKPRYPPESAIIKQFRHDQEELLSTHSGTETLPKPPSARFALPHPNALLTTCGSARDAQSIIRQRKLEATMSATTSARGLMSMEGTLSGYSVRQGASSPPQHDHPADGDDTLPSPHVPLPAISTSPVQTSPRRAAGHDAAHQHSSSLNLPNGGGSASMLSSRSVSPRDASPCHPLLPSLFEASHRTQSSQISRQGKGQSRIRPLVVTGLDRSSPTSPRVTESPRQ